MVSLMISAVPPEHSEPGWSHLRSLRPTSLNSRTLAWNKTSSSWPAASVNVPPRLFSLGLVNALPSWAEHLAEALLQEFLPRRWTHVHGVAARARGLAPVFGADADLLEAAAWLHDIGYTPGLAATGLHQLHGARYLRDAQHADALLCRLVAHHTCAIIEAGECGLADVLSSEIDPAPDVLASVLTCCDMTTSPDGQPVRVDRRLAEIHDRYGSGHLVSRSIQRATPMILRAVGQVHQRAAQTHSSANRWQADASRGSMWLDLGPRDDSVGLLRGRVGSSTRHRA